MYRLHRQLVVLIIFLSACYARAVLIVYEGFDTAGATIDGTVGASAVGLAHGWTAPSTTISTGGVQSPASSLPVVDGYASSNVDINNDISASVVATYPLAVNPNGSLFFSFLAKDIGAESYIGMVYQYQEFSFVFPDSTQVTTQTETVGQASTSVTYPISAINPTLFVGRIDVLSADPSNITATLTIMTPADPDNPSNLITLMTSDPSPSHGGVDNSYNKIFGTVTGGSFDEFRIGTELSDVFQAVPEPGSILAVGLGALGVLRKKRRNHEAS